MRRPVGIQFARRQSGVHQENLFVKYIIDPLYAARETAMRVTLSEVLAEGPSYSNGVLISLKGDSLPHACPSGGVFLVAVQAFGAGVIVADGHVLSSLTTIQV
eukprot:scaffold778_cov37-Prasinocladus_malaysianus.AAC.1